MHVSDIPFDAVTTLLMFLVGVPAIVLQTLPPEIRRVVAKRWGRLVATLSIPALFGVALFAAGVYARNLPEPQLTWAWSGILLVLALTGFFTIFYTIGRYGRRIAIVRSLASETGRRISTSGRLVEESLSDLVDLGRQSEPGREREMVLDALLELALRVSQHPRYTGDGLEDLVAGVLDIALLTAPLNAQNLSSATNLLGSVVIRYETQDASSERTLKHADLISAIRALAKLGRSALRLDNEGVALAAVQAVGAMNAERTEIFVSQALFEVGVAALRGGQVLVAMAALERLMTLIEVRGTSRGELVADTLGLVAHFWARGETARSYAGARLARLAAKLEGKLDGALEFAARHCAQTTQFRTSDRVQHMRRELTARAASI
jgi:hypothetical protein